MDVFGIVVKIMARILTCILRLMAGWSQEKLLAQLVSRLEGFRNEGLTLHQRRRRGMPWVS